MTAREFMARYGQRLREVSDAKLAVWVPGHAIGLKSEALIDGEVFAVTEAMTKLIPWLAGAYPFIRPFMLAGEGAFIHQMIKRLNREPGHIRIVTAGQLLRGLEHE